MLHELTIKIREFCKAPVNMLFSWENIDKIIRDDQEQLKNKILGWHAEELYHTGEFVDKKLEKILGLTLPPIEERVAEAMRAKAIGTYEIDLISNWQDLAKIAVKMVREESNGKL